MGEIGLRVYQQEQRMREWISQVETCRNSGLPVRVWCEQQGISVHTYYKRQEKVFKYLQSQRDATFVEIPVTRGFKEADRQPVARIRKPECEIEIYTESALVKVITKC